MNSLRWNNVKVKIFEILFLLKKAFTVFSSDETMPESLCFKKYCFNRNS